MQVKYESDLNDTREKVEKVIHEIMAGVKSTGNVKQAGLDDLDILASFLGSK